MPTDRGRPGVFCIEGEWSEELTDELSVEPLLRMTEQVSKVSVIHRRVATVPELKFLLRRWTQSDYEEFTLGYLAFHGSKKGIELGEEQVPLEDLGEMLRGACKGKAIHFGSCGVMKAPESTLKAFLKKTGAKAICGYTKDVYWLPSAAFDMLLIAELLHSQRLAVAAKRVKKWYPELADELGFTLVVP